MCWQTVGYLHIQQAWNISVLAFIWVSSSPHLVNESGTGFQLCFDKVPGNCIAFKKDKTITCLIL